MSNDEEKREKQKLQISRDELIARMTRLIPKDGSKEVLPGFFLARSSKPMASVHSIYKPAFCFVVQGRKQALLGEEVFWYDPGHYLIFSVDLPLVFKVEEASLDMPYLGFRINLDPSLVAPVIMESELEIKKGDASVKGINVNAVDADLFDAAVRLIRLIDKPNNQKVLVPLVMKEIIYRLLISGQGARLGHLMTSEGDTHRISKAIGQLRENFDQPLQIENMARSLGMSLSGFHHHFKSVTAMSPLQFQKQIRLQEARRLMLGEDLDAASAGFRVGYEDASHFNREYKRLFGDPPQRDIAKLRSGLEV